MQFGKCQYCKNNGKKCKYIMAYAMSALGQMEHTINYSQSKNTERCFLKVSYDCENFSPKNKCFEVIEKYKYKPLCPIGCTDCIHDLAYIYAEEPEWYKELYGDKKPEEVIDDYCKPFIKDNVCYGYDNEDK